MRRQLHHLPTPHTKTFFLFGKTCFRQLTRASALHQVERKPKVSKAAKCESKLLLFSQGNLQNANQQQFMQTRLVCLPLCRSPCVLWCVSFSKVIASCMDPDSAMVTGRAKLSVKIIMAPRWWARAVTSRCTAPPLEMFNYSSFSTCACIFFYVAFPRGLHI